MKGERGAAGKGESLGGQYPEGSVEGTFCAEATGLANSPPTGTLEELRVGDHILLSAGTCVPLPAPMRKEYVPGL